MKSIENFRWATQGMTAVLLSGIAFAASGAEQMMRVLPAGQSTATSAVVQAGTAPTAVPVSRPSGSPTKPMSLGPAGIPASGMRQPQRTNSNIARPGLTLLPDLTFSNMTVDKTTYFDFAINSGAKSLVVNNIVPSVSSTIKRDARDPCDRSYTFPLQLIVKNVGQAEFMPRDSFQVVGVTIGPWNSAKDIIKLAKTATQQMNFSVMLRPGKYMLNANIDLHNNVAEARTDNNTINWPLEVTCKVNRNEVRKLNK